MKSKEGRGFMSREKPGGKKRKGEGSVCNLKTAGGSRVRKTQEVGREGRGI